jgi:hypothetical protein
VCRSGSGIGRASRGFVDSVPADQSEVREVCNKGLAIDKNGSTKSMARHLDRYHHITKPVATDQPTVAAFYIDGEPVKVSFFFD